MSKESVDHKSLFGGSLSVFFSPENEVNLTGLKDGNGKIHVDGKNNSIEFSANSRLNGSIHVYGDNNRMVVGQNARIGGRVLIKGNGQVVSIGEGTTFQSVYILCQEGCNVIVGRHCMFSRDVEIRTTDAHSIVDLNLKSRINIPDSVEIEDHVWLGVGVLVGKGSRLPSDCVVGAKSFVNRKFSESNTIIAGVPANIVKRGITWNRGRSSKFTKEDLFFWKR